MDVELAAEYGRKSLALRREVCQEAGQFARNYGDVSGTAYNLAEVLEAIGKLDEALVVFQEAADAEQRVVGPSPNDAAPASALPNVRRLWSG